MPENDGWTAQAGTAYIEADPEPGQKYAERQLPDPEVAKAAGFAVLEIPETLIAADGDPQGPEPWEDGRTEVQLDGPVDTTPAHDGATEPQQAPGAVAVQGVWSEPEAPAEEAAPAAAKGKHKKAADAAEGDSEA